MCPEINGTRMELPDFMAFGSNVLSIGRRTMTLICVANVKIAKMFKDFFRIAAVVTVIV